MTHKTVVLLMIHTSYQITYHYAYAAENYITARKFFFYSQTQNNIDIVLFQIHVSTILSFEILSTFTIAKGYQHLRNTSLKNRNCSIQLLTLCRY